MTVYALAQLTIHDPERYGRYVARFMDVLEPYRGRLLAADGRPRVVEGDWDAEKVVLIAFDSEQDFTAWSTSPEYRRIAIDRVAATTGSVVLVRGL